jgi:nucleoside-diphosphate-sugar epimerase
MAQQGKKENILIFGATGYIGTHITNKIVESKGSFGRIAIFTSPSTVEKKADVIKKLKAEGVEVIVGDATNDDDIVKALQGPTPLQHDSHVLNGP